jgi:hypothetical protein
MTRTSEFTVRNKTFGELEVGTQFIDENLQTVVYEKVVSAVSPFGGKYNARVVGREHHIEWFQNWEYVRVRSQDA